MSNEQKPSDKMWDQIWGRSPGTGVRDMMLLNVMERRLKAAIEWVPKSQGDQV